MRIESRSLRRYVMGMGTGILKELVLSAGNDEYDSHPSE